MPQEKLRAEERGFHVGGGGWGSWIGRRRIEKRKRYSEKEKLLEYWKMEMNLELVNGEPYRKKGINLKESGAGKEVRWGVAGKGNEELEWE
ncbi:hypothetical protein Pmani_009989 [Petrolisthes manimaculis]|uniref:Uncharacterized protein n=1 Tax=Petrolisthes manimaculis TaxID=1843537 RepID=A0AAE1Q5X3_9EUCA|nr:hypothetical protein Pmani_009989 [Petrolisthes manimaculis]